MTTMNKQIYEKPVHIESVNDCNFYHTTDIPGVRVVEGQWDLRKGVDEYLGKYDFSSKRVLESENLPEVLGFSRHQVTFHQQRAFNHTHDMFTIVSSRP